MTKTPEKNTSDWCEMNRLIAADYEAMAIIRWHCWGGLPGQTVSQHTLGMLTLKHRLYGTCDPLAELVMFHDFPEWHTGDVPSPAKSANPALKAELEKEERKIGAHYGWEMDYDKIAAKQTKPLPPEQAKVVFRLLDCYEIYVFLERQRFYGNGGEGAEIVRRGVGKRFGREVEEAGEYGRDFCRRLGWDDDMIDNCILRGVVFFNWERKEYYG